MPSLGYSRYFAQAGDWGSVVTSILAARNSDSCAGIHLNMLVGAPPSDRTADLTETEKDYLRRFDWFKASDCGYSALQGTRPQTIGYALTDSPIGQMVWLAEKYHSWTDCGHEPGGQSVGGHPERALSKNAMLDTISLYWLTATAASAARLYWRSFGNFVMEEVRIPTASSVFPYEMRRLSRRWVKGRYRNIVY